MANEFRYEINAEGIKTLEDVIEIFRQFHLGVYLHEKRDKDKIECMENLLKRNLVTKRKI